MRQSSDHEDSEGEPQVYGKGMTMEENRRGSSTADVTTTYKDDAATPSKSVASAEVHPSPRQAYAESDSVGSVA